MELLTLQEASIKLNISVTTLRRRVYARSIPFTRCNLGKYGKILLDIDLVQQVLRNEAIANLRASGGFEEKCADYDCSFSEAEEPPSMANVDKLFGSISKDDVSKGLFASDTFFGKSSDEEATSETLRTKKVSKL